MTGPWQDYAQQAEGPWQAYGAAKPPDQYQQAALDEQKRLQAAGVDTSGGYSERILNGLTFGAAPDILAGLQTPIEMAKHGTMNPAEGYRYAKARENLIRSESEDKTGKLGTALELGAGLGSGVGLSNAGATLLKPGMGLLARTGAMAGEGAGYGGVTGFFNGGDTLGDKLSGAAGGALAGGAVGAALPTAGAVLGTVASPILSNASALLNPERFAQNKLAEALTRSGKSLPEVQQALADAGAAGQGEYTLADALGHAGQRSLATVTRSPGDGRQAAVDFLEQRQAGQSKRLASALSDAFDAPQTAAQTEAGMRSARSLEADANYGAARDAAGAVDVSPAINVIDQTLQPGYTSVMRPQTNIADNSIESALRRARGYLSDGKSVLSDFGNVQSAKDEISNLIENASPTVQRKLIPVRNALDDALAMASQPYANARDKFKAASQAIDAIDSGKAAAMRGRTEDTVPAFGALSPDAQQGFRAGYVDPLIADTQKAAIGVNKARPFTSQAMQTEIPAFASPGKGQPLLDKIQRENTMFETRNAALGGSKTADNLADLEDAKIDPSIVAALLHGNFGTAAAHALRGASNVASGLTPTARAHLAEMLLTTPPNAAALDAKLAPVIASTAKRQAIVRALTSGGMAATGEFAQKR